MTDVARVLRGLPYFADLDSDVLEAVAAKSKSVSFQPGDTVIQEGSSSSEMYVVVDGEVRVVKRSGERALELARLQSGDVVGELALLDQAPRMASVEVERKSTLVEIPADAFEILLQQPSVVRRMFRTVTSRLRENETALRHEERMAALGRMAAQLMHELNNPAAAVGRSSENLERTTSELFDQATALTIALTDGVDLIPPARAADLSPLDRSEIEDGLVAYLEELGITDGWEYGPSMVEEGWTSEALRASLSVAEAAIRPGLARWAGLRSQARQLAEEIAIAAGRVSELVRIVKEYSFVDQAPIQSVDIGKGLEDTLTLMKHRLRGIETVIDIQEDLPHVEAPGRDLNQIWTNLIDNAAGAMDGAGTLTVAARSTDDGVSVTISDTGPGIPPDLAEKIFDPFFTTKEPGEGTGLGLHTVHSIIQKVGAEIRVDTSDEGTAFTVDLPAG